MNIFSYIIGSIFASATLIAGLLLKISPPKKINNWYGFKTKVTAKNQQTWDFAHKICADVLLIYSIFSILLFVVILIIFSEFFESYWYIRMIFGLVLALTGVIIVTIITQTKTKNIDKHIEKR